MEDINSIKPLLDLDFPWLAFASVLLIMLGLIVIFWVALMKILSKRKPKSKPEEVAVPKLKTSPEKEALNALMNLRKSGHIEREESDTFYLKLDRVFKRYLGNCHHKPIGSYTQTQLKQYLQLLGTETESIMAHIQRSQQAKFARAPISQEQMNLDLSWVESFVKSKQAHQLSPL